MRFTFLVLFMCYCINSIAQSDNGRLDEVFTNYETQSINSDQFINQIKTRSNDKVYLSIDKWDLILEDAGILSPEYRFIDEEGKEINRKGSRPIPMDGYTSKGGRASITFAEDFVYGFIEDAGELYYIEPARFYSQTSNTEEVVIYNTKNVRSGAPLKCGVESVKEKEIKVDLNESSSRSAGLCYDVEYAIVNDWSMYDKYGAGGLEARNIAITNNVNTNYKDDFSDEIRLVITGQFNATCASCNPFGVSTDLGLTLDNFTAWANSNISDANSGNYIPNDVASFWSDVFSNSGTVGLAWVGVICSSYKYNVLSDLSTDANTLRVLTAHELGHNFNASHDASGSGFLMAPSVNNTNTWSSTSINAINGHINSVKSCFDLCSDSPAIVLSNASNVTIVENGASSNGGPCQEDYQELTTVISISKAPTSNVTVGLNTSGSTASAGYDFDLITNSIIFTPSGGLDQTVTYRIYDDVIDEDEETLQINFNVLSGPAETSNFNSIEIDIISNDEIETLTTGSGDTVVYGNSTLSLNGAGFFEGSRTDVRSRFLILASDLNAAGINAGEIDMLAFYVYEKTSTGSFNNFSLSMKEVTNATLDGVGWGGTETVFTGNVSTVSTWNYFNFATPFDWDGTSNIYVEMCFDNSSIIGLDKIVLFDTGDANAQMCSWSTNTFDNCGSVTNWTYYYDRAPYVLLRQKGSTEAETYSISSSAGRISAGETANLFSDNGKIIASITNIGSSSLECIDATVRTSGNSRNDLPFSSGQYSDKTIEVNVDGSGDYELTLYFTEEELDIWGTDVNSLNFVKTTTSIASASSGIFIETDNVNTNIGAENVIAYSTTISGSGFFALSDGAALESVAANVAGTFENADVVIGEFGKGVLLKNSLGDQYLLEVNSAGDPMLTLNNALEGSVGIPDGDLCIITPGKALLIKRTANAYTRISVDANGAITSTNTSTLPTQRITLEQGHFGLAEFQSGVIFQNSENECFKLFVDEDGVLKTGTVPCP